jgi:hypothetical protein
MSLSDFPPEMSSFPPEQSHSALGQTGSAPEQTHIDPGEIGSAPGQSHFPVGQSRSFLEESRAFWHTQYSPGGFLNCHKGTEAGRNVRFDFPSEKRLDLIIDTSCYHAAKCTPQIRQCQFNRFMKSRRIKLAVGVIKMLKLS